MRAAARVVGVAAEAIGNANRRFSVSNAVSPALAVNTLQRSPHLPGVPANARGAARGGPSRFAGTGNRILRQVFRSDRIDRLVHAVGQMLPGPVRRIDRAVKQHAGGAHPLRLASSAGGSMPCSSASAASCSMRRAITIALSVGQQALVLVSPESGPCSPAAMRPARRTRTPRCRPACSLCACPVDQVVVVAVRLSAERPGFVLDVDALAGVHVGALLSVSGWSGWKLMLQAQQFSSSIGTQTWPPSACSPNGGISVNHGKSHCVMRQ